MSHFRVMNCIYPACMQEWVRIEFLRLEFPNRPWPLQWHQEKVTHLLLRYYCKKWSTDRFSPNTVWVVTQCPWIPSFEHIVVLIQRCGMQEKSCQWKLNWQLGWGGFLYLIRALSWDGLIVDLNFHLSPLIPGPDRANAAIACLNNKRQPIHPIS